MVRVKICGICDAASAEAAVEAGADLRRLLAVVRSRGLTALVEVHTLGEAEAAVEGGAPAVGVNHRDLRTFQIDMSLTAAIAPMVAASTVLVAESGIRTAAARRPTPGRGHSPY